MTVNSYHLDFQTTIYGGEAVYNGDGTWTVTVTHANIASYNGESINEPWISSMDAYEAGATPTTGAQVVYPLATPLTYTLTTEELTTLLGQNNVWCDAGEISLPLPYVTLTNGRKAVTPTITAEQAATITFDGTSVAVSAGESIIPQLVLESGSKEVGVNSAGAVTFSYREGSL